MNSPLKTLDVEIPHRYTERPYQSGVWDAIGRGILRIIQVWHRRSGKDKTDLNIIVSKMCEKVGAYYYFFPTYSQGKKALWEAIGKDGFKLLDHFPKQIVKRKNDTEMKIELINGSIFQVIGTDNIDSIVGTNPIGTVFSEYSLQDPRAWNYIRPILAENGGFAIFNFTPRGKNHGFILYEAAKNDPPWFVEVLTVNDTKAIPTEVLEQEKKEIIRNNGGDDSLFFQEYHCSFELPVQGSYYTKQLRFLEAQGRMTDVPYDPMLDVDVFFDLGVGDSTALWFVQSHFNEVRCIDYHETSGEGLAYYKGVLMAKGYRYGTFYMPHDVNVRELATGKSRKEMAEALGIKPITVLPRLSLEDGIEAARNLLPRCFFDKTKCERGIDALLSYHKEYDEANHTYKNHPKHDWSSHGADAFRYVAIGFKSGFDKQSDQLESMQVEHTRANKRVGE